MKQNSHLSSAFLWAFFLTSFSLFTTSCTTKTQESSKETTEVKEAAPVEKKTAENENAHPLAGSKWRLVEFTSMDDAQGVQRPSNPLLYTMELKADSTAHMRLNCNFANGTWKFEPSADPSNGSFEFGPLATTKALCPPPSMDELVASQAQWVRGYLLKDGKLYLSLMADGGIFTWEPQIETPYLAKADAAIEQAVLQASPDYKKDVIGNARATYVYSLVDLNNDGTDEAIVYLMGSIFCGTGGCNMMVFTKGDDGYRLVNDFSLARTPVVISPAMNNGWNDIWKMESGGGAPSNYVRYAFNGKKYTEKERKGTESIPEGVVCLAGDFDFQKGIPLEPID